VRGQPQRLRRHGWANLKKKSKECKKAQNVSFACHCFAFS
jgi:hypothetical protein